MPTTVPFFAPDITESDITACAEVLRSGWLTTGPCAREFEKAFASAVGARHAVAVNSCTAALHLALEALGLRANQGVLVPTMTFAATAEVVRYFGAVPLLVDCDPVTGNLSLDAAAARLSQVRLGGWPPARRVTEVVGIMPVHVGGLMLDMGEVRRFASRHGLWIVEDAAHALPAAWRPGPDAPWQRCGEDTADVTCYSFYANKTITTGEGGMAVTASAALAERMRLMSLHGLSHDAWNRYTGHGSWDYRIVAPGFKYNLTDIAAALGLRQLARAEAMRQARARIASYYLQELAGEAGIALPPVDPDRVHAWHLFPIRVEGDPTGARRNAVIEMLRGAGVTCSVHWRPLHLHPYYQETFGYEPDDCPAATALFPALVSLPIFSRMTGPQMDAVVAAVRAAVRTLLRPVQV
ncbi:MAG TPA: DegT/DnrJ/EryC1/StrS family aminotransferase [Vicinamibacterales bacterium]